MTVEPPGDTATFEDYVATQSVALQRFAYLITRDPEEARDCVQDALIGIYPRWSQIRELGNVGAYVRRSIVNASVSRWRKRHGVVPLPDPTSIGGAPAVPDPAIAVGDADAAWRLCADLPPAQRAAVVLRFWEDRTFAEIGTVLGCPEATARSHVHRALTTLRRRLGPGGDHD